MVHAVDSSPNMIALNRHSNARRVTYECADVFEWRAERRFDRVAAAFLVSHVPDALLPQFVETIDRSNSNTGTLLLIDEAVPAKGSGNGVELRDLTDGRIFRIVKIYRSIEQVRVLFEPLGYRPSGEISAGQLFATFLSRVTH